MRLGIIADVHANLVALQVVLQDGESEHVDEWMFLGDAVGRGPDPVATVRLLKHTVPFSNWLIGNHDLYVTERVSNAGLKPYDRIVHRKHREALRDWARQEKFPSLWVWCRRTWKRSKSRPKQIKHGRVIYWFVHAALGNESENAGLDRHTYIMPWDILENSYVIHEQLKYLRADTEQGVSTILIHGHTHVPYMAVRLVGMEYLLLGPIHYGRPINLERFDVVFINPGSVGQPRNGDARPHAAYGILDLDEQTFEFRRVFYDCRETCRKMRREGYDRNLVNMLRGNHPRNPLYNKVSTWKRWREVYEETEWGWKPKNR